MSVQDDERLKQPITCNRPENVKEKNPWIHQWGPSGNNSSTHMESDIESVLTALW